jgi:hypothetical protein
MLWSVLQFHSAIAGSSPDQVLINALTGQLKSFQSTCLLSLTRFTLLARRSPRVSSAFDGAEMKVFTCLCVYLFRPFRCLPVYWADVFVFRVLLTASGSNQTQEQWKKKEQVSSDVHTTYFATRQQAQQFREFENRRVNHCTTPD